MNNVRTCASSNRELVNWFPIIIIVCINTLVFFYTKFSCVRQTL